MIYDCTKWDKGDFDTLTQTPERCIMVVNYDLIFRRPQFLNLENFTLVLDESSIIQNDKAKRTKFVMKLKPANVILLSGTPTSGKYENLWSQCQLLGWNVSLNAYNANYVNWKKIDVGGVPMKIVNKANPYKNVERLKRKMREHGAVFLKTDEVFDLPERTFIEKLISKTKDYNRFQKDKIVTVDGVEYVGDTALTMRLYSRMLCGHLNPAKLDAFRDLLESTNDRMIVFYNFNDELHALKNIAAELNKPISEVNGHKKDLTAYNSENDAVTLVQYQAGAKGLNLQKANTVVYFSPTDKCEDWQQSIKRIHRIGQMRPCFYYKLVCAGSIEEEVYAALNRGVDYTDYLFQEKGVTKCM